MSTTQKETGFLPRAILAGIGAAAGALDCTRRFVGRAIERGEMAEAEAQEAALAHPQEPPVGSQPPAKRRWPSVATRSDLRSLQQQIEQLSEEISLLERQRAEAQPGVAPESS
jgi:polyhydroxyalkanoate synthesis regulator phasin